MLSKELRDKLMKLIRENPKEAIKEIEKEPQLLDILLRSENRLENEEREKIKYINMTQQSQKQLQEASKKLKTSQGALIGLGIILLLELFDK